jgi:hypothetical protein
MATINPFQAPINYAVDVQSPFEAALGGFKIGAGVAEAQARAQEREDARIAREQARAAQEQFQSGLNAFFAKPPAERKIEELQPLLVGANKQQFDALKLIGENMGKEKLDSSKKFTSQVLLAFEANPETAKTILQERIDAETDPSQKRAFQDILTIANQDVNQAARLVESLGAGTFGEDWYKGITAVRNERRTAALQPAALKKAVADADAAVAEAQRKIAEAADTPTRLAAEQDLRKAQTAQQQALTAASVGGEARAAAQAPAALLEATARADAAVADAERKVAEAADTPSRLEAEAELRQAQIAQQQAQTAQQEALTAASIGGEARAAAQAPEALRRLIADADKAIADAKTAQATAANAAETAKANADLAKANAQKAAVDAKYADQIKLQELKKKAADLGLTQAQTGSALAQTKKLGVETARAALELEALKTTGGIDPAKAFEQEEKIRREFQARTKVYSELDTTFSNLQASAQAKTGPGDIALITGFMKMLDPGSVVRETEFATARDTAGLFDRLSNQAQKLRSGQIFSLDSKQRQEYVSLAKQYLDAAQKKAADDKKALGVVVKNYRLNPDNVFGPEPASAGGGRGSVVPPAIVPSASNSVTVGGQTYTRPANFTDAQWNAYKQSVGAQ